MSRKFFTLVEANRTLPLVKRIVQDILDVYPQWKDFVDQYELVASKARPEWGESQEQLDLKTQIDAVAVKINGLLGECRHAHERTDDDLRKLCDIALRRLLRRA